MQELLEYNIESCDNKINYRVASSGREQRVSGGECRLRQATSEYFHTMGCAGMLRPSVSAPQGNGNNLIVNR